MHLFDQYETFFKEHNAGTLILTPNQRMSRFVQAQYNLWRASCGDGAWPSLRSHSLSVWVQLLWQTLQTAAAHPYACRTILTVEQERLLWLQAIEDSQHGYDLLADESMADLASQAWRFLRLWRKSLADLPDEAQEQQLLRDWAQRFDALCLEKSAIDTTTQLEVMCQCVEGGALALPERAILLGFDDTNPLEQRLIDSLRTRGVDVGDYDITLNSTCKRVALTDTDAELTSMARWAAALVEENASCSIALVVPDLADMRVRVTRILTQVFEPQSVFPDQVRHAPGFNMSAAQPLAQTPLIAAAFAALQLNLQTIERDQVQRLLGSAFLFSEQELPARLQLSVRLSERYLDVPVTALRATAGEAADDETPLCPDLHQRLHSFHDVSSRHQKQRRSYSDWAALFDLQLQELGWPGQRTQDTLEFQQLEHWPQLLSQLAALDQVSTPVTVTQALSHLARLAYTPFHAQTEDSPVQVLGLLEAAGQQFDYLWVMGLDNRKWPEPSKPNPLLPLDLQRQWGMPRASAERELQIAQRLTQRLSQSAHVVVMSAPVVDGDQPLQPSPLIAGIEEVALEDLRLAKVVDYKEQLFGAALEQCLDERAPQVKHPQKLRGGTQILKNQAACPFKAFAVHRLQARSAEPLQPGITPLVRGNLLHNALEICWRKLQNQSALLALSEMALDDVIDASLAQAWRNIRGQEQLGPKLKILEKQRAHELLRAWLELEKQRPPFKVLFNEKAVSYELGGIPLVIRYDRIDELADESLLVLDYKTGRTDINAWAGNRPDEPQVPLYTLAQGDRVQAAVLVQINAQEVAAKGIAVDPEVLNGLSAPESLPRLDLPNSWQEIVAHWRSTLTGLAQEFMRGEARVDPKSRSLTCRYCELQSLCRIHAKIDTTSLEEPADEQ